MKTVNQLNLGVKGYRLMTRDELIKFETQMPDVNPDVYWWLADVDPTDDGFIAFAEGNHTDDDMYIAREVDTFVRVALDLTGTAAAGLKAGDEFVYCGYVFTVLDEALAVSNNFIGCAKYYDEDLIGYREGDDEITCTLINGVLGSLFQ